MTHIRYIRIVILSLYIFLQGSELFAQQKDTLRFPLKDRRGDRFSWKYRNPFDISDTSFIKQQIEYDPVTRQFYITEKIGGIVYRKQTSLTYDELWKLQNRQNEIDYFNERAQTLFDLNRKVMRPKPRVYDKLFDRIFGISPQGLKVDIKPQGTVDLTLGYQGQNIKNPTLPENARKNGGFDFDMNSNVNIMANIGDKLKLPISYNTLSNFDFENQLKLDYKGMDDEIIKSVEAGNMSFQSKGTLMASVQSLFGVKTQLQFGKLFITTAIASQRSQRQSLTLQGGGLNQFINKKLDDYEENKHFLLSQYFVNNYEKAMKTLPFVNSQVQILRMEVWVTNRTGTTVNTRGIVAFTDLGENTPSNPLVHSLTSNALPQNGANDLYPFLAGDEINNRNPAMINTILSSRGFKPVVDYEKTFARKLEPSEYYFNPQVGFLSLNQQLQPDEVLGVAFQYTYNGKVYTVGEFSQDVTVDSTQGVQKVLFLKLLKATSQRPGGPIWNLMMKNVYALDFTGIQREGFNMNVVYQEPSGGVKRYLPETDPEYDGRSLLSILNVDRLNNRNDPFPDGLYDFVDSFTIVSQAGRIIFPVLKPFGAYLDSTVLKNQPLDIKQKYEYNQLYDSIKAIAQTYANLNRFALQGTIKGSSNTDINLGGFNIPPGSVSVSAGGQALQENVDYIIDYNLGTLKIINQAIINSGLPVSVQFENNANYGIQQKSFFGLRLDYLVNKNLSIGATMERLAERPYFTKVSYGEDPVRNTMYGVDFNYRSELPGLTRLLNKLPFYDSKAVSSINAYGEAAVLKPGHPKQIGKGNEGLVYIDDFESARSNIDLRFPFVAWTLASTPQGNGLFPEAEYTDSLPYGMNRAKLAWYNIEPTLQDRNSTNNPIRGDLNALSDPRVRAVYTNELFPQRTTNIINNNILSGTFDLAYYPTERGPYNFTTDNLNINANGKLTNPKKRWGGIMRGIDQTDFETGNIEFIEFWVQDPFLNNRTSTGGKLILNLGNISEDILKDGRRFYENGLNTPTQPAAVDTTGVWGRAPYNPIQITQAFSNDPADRPYQDVGFDGLTDDSEKIKRAPYLTQLATNFTTSSAIYQKALTDPSNDNYKWYRDPQYDAAGTGILGRYKDYNNPQGNSPVSAGNSEFSPAATLYPDNEDLNRDNTLNETEEYYEYEIDLNPGMGIGLTKYITDVRQIRPKLPNGRDTVENWYLFRVPIKGFTGKVGNIPDFKSIRFMRMYLTGFEDSVVLRFARLDLVRNIWRTFTYKLDTAGYVPIPSNSNTVMNVLAVNLEENSSRQPIPYKVPPGIERVQELGNNGINILQNEQAMSLKFTNLNKGDARAVFKTLNLDMRQYGQLRMFLHAESVIGQRPVNDGELVAVIRMGQDFLDNYYEVRIPLKITLPNAATAAEIWPSENDLNLILNDLVQLKLRRNSAQLPSNKIYREAFGTQTYSVMGNPNFAEVQGILIGIENTIDIPLSTEIWANELRLSQIDESGGWAALGRVDVQLADLGTLSVSANTYTQGFGTIEQKANERARQDLLQFDAALNIDAGKLLPKKAGISIPVYASINKTIITPKYDPYDQDVLYKYKLNNAGSKRDSIKHTALDQTTIKTINLTNVKFINTSTNPKLWSLSNFDFSYSFTQFKQTNPLILLNEVNKHRFGAGYTYNASSKFIEPFGKLIKNKGKWLAAIREFNFNPIPSLVSVRLDINRQYGKYTPRIVSFDNKVERVDTTYDKYFTFDRYYNLRWDLTRSLNVDFSATNFARIDEPFGALNTKAKKDSVKRNFFKGGRNTLYNQQAVLSYNFPFAKIPLIDWVSSRYSYTATYRWIGASLLTPQLGNVIENSQQNNLNGEFDFQRLYSKSKWLTKITEPVEKDDDEGGTVDEEETKDSAAIKLPSRVLVIKGLKGKSKREALRKWRKLKRDKRKQDNAQKEVAPANGILRAAANVVTMVKRVSVNYSETYNSRLPGYKDSTKIIGQNWNTMQPGLDYVFGRQPDSNWLNAKAAKGVFTRDTTFNLLYSQDFSQRLSLTAQLEPVKELLIDINLDKSYSKNYSELFKDTAGLGEFRHLSPLAAGGFNVSYISFKTLFEKYKPTEVSQTFNKFQDYRMTIAKRLATSNPYWIENGSKLTQDGFPEGYGRYAQDVLIPAFLAAYTGKDPNGISLISQSNPNIKSNPFSGIKPLPNWKVTFTGLTKIPAIANVFSNFAITHGYTSNLSMNSFTSALLYTDPRKVGAPSFRDTISGNFVPFFLVPNITIQEQFAPLFGIDITTNSQTNLRFEYSKSRQLSLSLIDFQLAEMRSTTWTFGGSFRQRGVKLPFKIPFMKPPKEGDPDDGNDLNINLDLSLRDDIQSNSRLDQANAYSTGGQKVITIQPSIDYVISNRVNIKFYFDQQRTIPYISTSAPTTTTRAGLQISISLAPNQ